MPTKLLIVEDHPLFADALRLALSNVMKSVRFTHVSTLSAAKDLIFQGEKFDILLVDLCLPDTFGLDGLVELRKLSPKQPIVAISAFSDPGVMAAAFVCGASGFIPKSASKDALRQGIQDVLAGDVTMPGSCQLPRNLVATAQLKTSIRKLTSLTAQQYSVLQLLRRGLPNEQIARELCIGKKTVAAHITAVLRKLGTSSRTHAVVEASKLDLNAVQALYAGEAASANVRSWR
jgi:DNA-binding NarL/FixJ family response regulator